MKYERDSTDEEDQAKILLFFVFMMPLHDDCPCCIMHYESQTYYRPDVEDSISWSPLRDMKGEFWNSE